MLAFSYACFGAAAQCLQASTKDLRVPVQMVLSQFAAFQEMDELGNERLLPNSWGFKVLLSKLMKYTQMGIFLKRPGAVVAR